MTHSSHPTTSVSQQYPSYGPPWQGYNLHQGGYGESRMFPQQSSQHKGHRLQVHRECLQDRQETILSIGQHLPAHLLHLDLLPAHLGDLPLASQRNDSCRLRNHGKLMSQGLQTCRHCGDFLRRI
jgi:hypothetical protein